MSLKEDFAKATAPDPGEMRGYYEVRLITRILPDIRFFGHRKFFPDDVDIENEGKGGFNEFFRKIRIGSFKIDVIDSILGDGQKVLRVNYNRKGNLFLIKILNDELKKIGDHYLGRGILNLFGFKFNSFYFSLRKE